MRRDSVFRATCSTNAYIYKLAGQSSGKDMTHEFVGRSESEFLPLSSPFFSLLLNIYGRRKDRLIGIVPRKIVLYPPLVGLFYNGALLLLMLVAGSDSAGHLGNVMRIVLSILQLWQAVGICDALIPLRFEIVQSLVGGTFNGNG